MSTQKTSDVSNNNKKSISLHTEDTPFLKGARFLVIPADLNQNFTPMTGEVDALDGYAAWLSPDRENLSFPEDEEVLLIEFQDEFVLTHRSRVQERRNGKILLAPPTLTEKEESQLAPSTGRHDYRVHVEVPIQIRYLQENPGSLLRNGKLVDLSRGGMSFTTRDTTPYHEGDELNLQVVSWEYPVNLDATVSRVRTIEEGQSVAVRFKDSLNVRQREMVSAFIIQVQRRDALSRSLPTDRE
jgi:c-di-GMP-binding flagellar brake protein YcgR